MSVDTKRTTEELLEIFDLIIGKLAKWGPPKDIKWEGYEVDALVVALHGELGQLLDRHQRLLAAAKKLEGIASTHQWMHDEIGNEQLQQVLKEARKAIAKCEEGS